MNRTKLETELLRLGPESIQCRRKCEGVRNSPEEASLPWQAMVLGQSDEVSCVIVGLAPPRTASRNQRLLVTARDQEEMLGYRRSRVESSAFYSRLDAFRRELELDGAAIWTTVCKSERIKGQKLPPETVQTCAESYLARELELVDKSVPIVAVGNRVFDTVRQYFPDRFVLNVPSPEGSRGDFQKTLDNKKLLSLAKTRIAANKPGALCLCPPCARKYFAQVKAY
jgi:uracil-DNA glycosylase